MTSLLHRLGFSYKKPKGVPGKAKKEEQKAFIKEYNEVKDKGLVYFAGSTHPMLNPVLTAGWIRRGKEFYIKTNSGRERPKDKVDLDVVIPLKLSDRQSFLLFLFTRFS